VTSSFEELAALGEAADVTGWDFSWLEGHASEERPPWGYAGQLSARLGHVQASLDIQTGGGEVLGGAVAFPPLAAATESWPPNVQAATKLLHPRGVVVVATADEPPLPFADAAFELVTSRHPATVWPEEIARVLAPQGTYFAQHVGPRSAIELIEYFLGPQADTGDRSPDQEVAAFNAAGLDVVDLQVARTQIVINDVAAVVYLLRKLVWWVPGFSVEKYRDRLREMHEQIAASGPFIANSTRHLIEARRP
jgi:hypothetical protein